LIGEKGEEKVPRNAADLFHLAIAVFGHACKCVQLYRECLASANNMVGIIMIGLAKKFPNKGLAAVPWAGGPSDWGPDTSPTYL
jgi:hypothetical protein